MSHLTRRLAHQRSNLAFFIWNSSSGTNHRSLSSLWSWRRNSAASIQSSLSEIGLRRTPIIARTAFPITLQGTLVIDSATGNQYYGNVNLVLGEPLFLYGTTYPGGRALNGAAFKSTTGSDTGNAPRNFVRGFGATQANFAVRRQFPLHEGVNLQFRAEAFNVFNHPNFGYVDPLLSDATFG
jgi:hypothetical protein